MSSRSALTRHAKLPEPLKRWVHQCSGGRWYGDDVAEFAVVIPTYRRPHLLAATVESVLRQTYPASEIVVVRDGPDAAVPESLRTGTVRVIDRPKEGVAAARNAGTAATHAAWLCFLDDDDLWHPDRLLVTAKYLDSHPDCAAVQADWWSLRSGA